MQLVNQLMPHNMLFQSYCCQQSLNGTNVGACNYHVSNCSYGYGVFLK